MPFVFRIAFMGMETHGAASDNLKEVWIEPVEYMKYLQEAVLFLNDRMLNVSIYNLPHCLLSNELKISLKLASLNGRNRFYMFVKTAVRLVYVLVCFLHL